MSEIESNKSKYNPQFWLRYFGQANWNIVQYGRFRFRYSAIQGFLQHISGAGQLFETTKTCTQLDVPRYHHWQEQSSRDGCWCCWWFKNYYGRCMGKLLRIYVNILVSIALSHSNISPTTDNSPNIMVWPRPEGSYRFTTNQPSTWTDDCRTRIGNVSVRARRTQCTRPSNRTVPCKRCDCECDLQKFNGNLCKRRFPEERRCRRLLNFNQPILVPFSFLNSLKYLLNE